MSQLPRDPARRLADAQRRMTPGAMGGTAPGVAPVTRHQPTGDPVESPKAKASHDHDARYLVKVAGAGQQDVANGIFSTTWIVAEDTIESRNHLQAFGNVSAGVVGGGTGAVLGDSAQIINAWGGTGEAEIETATATTVRPFTDGVGTVGTSTRRWAQIWATNGAIQTSDPREKADVRPVDPDAAVARVRAVAEHAIHFRWHDGQRTHEGFDARAVADVLAGECAAVCDPTVEADRRVNPYIGEPTQEWLDEHTPQQARFEDQVESVHEQLRARWAERREAFDADTAAMRTAPLGLRTAEMTPDLYVALAAALDRIDALEARLASNPPRP